MPKLWLTYAWKDNEEAQVDFVVQELEGKGLSVGIDRTQLIPGRRLWPQIDDQITNPAKCDAWAIYVTQNSLRSEPCNEELVYALDRALRTRGSDFPLIGIFPEPLDRELIPSAIATRLYVSLQAPDWADRVAAGVGGTTPGSPSKSIHPFVINSYGARGQHIIEVRPRTGRWHPFVFFVKSEERDLLMTIGVGPSGKPPEMSMVLGRSGVEGDGYSGLQMQSVVDSLNSAYIYCSKSPSEIMFGQRDAELIRVVRKT